MQNKKWFSVLLAIVVAIGLWVYVVTVENPEGERTLSNIPVSFVGEDVLREDYELLITESNVPSGISLTFNGKLADLNKLTENKSEIAVNIDIGNLRSPGDYPFSFDIYDVKLPASVSAQRLTMNYVNPRQVTISLAELEERTIPVSVVTDVKVAEGYTTDRLIQNYTEIQIEGPVESVNRVSYAQAILKRENVDETITAKLTYQLMDENKEIIKDSKITSDVSEIEVTLPVLLFKDVPLEIPIKEGGGATEDDTVIDITPKTVRLSADPKVLEGIQSIRLPALDLASLMTNNENVIRTITVPDGCKNISAEQEATVSVQIKNKEIRPLRISSNHFVYMGVPSTMNAVAKTSVLQIAVRADETVIDQITEDNVRVVIDFSNVTLGETATSMSMPVKIHIDGFDGAGVIGEAEYTVMVDLTPVS